MKLTNGGREGDDKGWGMGRRGRLCDKRIRRGNGRRIPDDAYVNQCEKEIIIEKERKKKIL